MTDTLILFDNNDKLEWVENIIETSNSSKIITFDFLAHKTLKNNNIDHDLIENYLQEDDQTKIDNFSIELATSWYKNDKLKKYLEYNELNIGNLLELELTGYFFSHLKRLLGIIRIIEIEKPRDIICSQLGNLVNTICKEKQIQVIATHEEKQSELYFDTIEIPLKIGSKIIALRISRQRFFHIKKISEMFFNIVFSLKPNLNNLKKRKSTLLLDFNPVIYQDLLRKLSDSTKNILLLNQRRPAIWNLRSLNIIRNSKCGIIQLDDFITNEVMSSIENDKKRLQFNLDSLWSNNELFQNIFSIYGHSFWFSIKDNFKNIIETRISELITRYTLLEKLFVEIEIDHIIEWAHTGFEEKIAIFLANKRNIPIILLQHGLYILNKKFDKYNSILPLLPSNGAKEAVWGNVMKEYLLIHGINQNEIILSGSPRHDNFFKQRIDASNNGTILIATSGFFHHNFNGTDTRSFDLLENFVREICKITKKYSDKKVIVKLHPEKAYFDVKSLIHEIDPTISIYQNENIIDLMRTCDCMISLNYSTALLDAMILNKPTLVVLCEKQDFEQELPIVNKAVLSVSRLEELEKKLDELVTNKKIREELIQRGKEFVESYLTNQGTSSEFIAEICNN